MDINNTGKAEEQEEINVATEEATEPDIEVKENVVENVAKPKSSSARFIDCYNKKIRIGTATLMCILSAVTATGAAKYISLKEYNQNYTINTTEKEAQKNEVKQDSVSAEFNTPDILKATTERKPGTGKSVTYKPPTDTVPAVPDDRTKIDFAAYGAIDYPEGVRTDDKTELKYSSVDVIGVYFGGDPELSEYVGTTDRLGKDIVIAIKQKFDSTQYKELAAIENNLPPIYLVGENGDKFKIQGLRGTFSGASACGFYGSISNENVMKLKKNYAYKIVADNSSEYRVKLEIPNDLTVTLTY